MKDKKEGTTTKVATHISMPRTGWQSGKHLTCPECGNDRHFIEVAHDVTITTSYIQNSDGSFTPRSDDSTINGDVKLYCGLCYADLSQYYRHFAEMIF